LAAIQAIYADHVRHGLGSFEETPPDRAEITRRWRSATGEGLPYLVCLAGDQVVGFAYAGRYRPRPAYRHSVEDSVYVASDAGRRGYGRMMLSALIDRCTEIGFRQMIAVIGDRENHGSIGLHAALGFVETGHLPAIGFKHGRWVDVVIMQRALGAGSATLPGPADLTSLA
jgi:phosphinothricin acetyltransferase